nr:hypothetical protein [Marinicella sp. W31]MDC2875480.1 hypothetical protein [Marinicella sp. W31]
MVDLSSKPSARQGRGDSNGSMTDLGPNPIHFTDIGNAWSRFRENTRDVPPTDNAEIIIPELFDDMRMDFVQIPLQGIAIGV